MRRSKEKKKNSDPPVPTGPEPLPQPRKSIVPTANLVPRGTGNRGTLRVLPDLQSLLSAGSRASGGSSLGSRMSGDAANEHADPNVIHHDPDHHRHSHHPKFEGLDIFKLRERSGSKGRKHGSDSDDRKVAPKTLVVTMDSKFEEKMEVHGNMLRRRVEMTTRDDMAFEIITNQIHDLGELEWMLDEDSKIILRKHVIYWKCALAMPRRKMHGKDTVIPLAATSYMYKPLGRCQRYKRKAGKCFRSENRHSLNPDYLRKQSLKDFHNKMASLEVSPSKVSDNINTKQRREDVFNAQAPAYSGYLSSNPMPQK